MRGTRWILGLGKAIEIMEVYARLGSGASAVEAANGTGILVVEDDFFHLLSAHRDSRQRLLRVRRMGWGW